MVKLKRISGEQTIKVLQKAGFEVVRQRGSHVVLKKTTPNGAIGCVVPIHKELATGTLHSILKQAQITIDEFSNFS